MLIVYRGGKQGRLLSIGLLSLINHKGSIELEILTMSYMQQLPKKDMQKSLKEQCLTRTYKKTSHMT